MSIEDRLKALEDRVAALEYGGTTTNNATERKVTSLREFINELHPATANDTALIIGYYVETIKKRGFFTNTDLKSGFSEAKIIPPKNFSDVVAKNAKKGLFMLKDGSFGRVSEWVLTNSGEDEVRRMQGLDD